MTSSTELEHYPLSLLEGFSLLALQEYARKVDIDDSGTKEDILSRMDTFYKASGLGEDNGVQDKDDNKGQVARYKHAELQELSLSTLQELASREKINNEGDKNDIIARLVMIYDEVVDIEEDEDGDMKMGVDKRVPRFDMEELRLLSIPVLQRLAQREGIDDQGDKEALLSQLGECYKDTTNEMLDEGDVSMSGEVSTPRYDINELKVMSSRALENLAQTNGLNINGNRAHLIMLLSELVEEEKDFNDEGEHTDVITQKHNNRELEGAMLNWSVKTLRELLRRLNQPVYGAKNKMVDRILCHLPIDDAATLLKRHRASLTSPEDEEMETDKDSERGLTVKEKRKTSDEVGDGKSPKRKTNAPSARSPSTTGLGSTKSRTRKDPVIQQENNAVSGGWVFDDDDASVTTAHVNNVHKTRIGLMVTTPPSSTEPDKKLVLQLQKWFAKMQESDKNFSLLPWGVTDHHKPHIKQMQDIPTTISKLKVYFTRARANTNGGRVYVDVQVQHSVPITDLKGDAEWFLEENNMAIYDKRLQVEATSQQGWLLYSTQSMDKDMLAEQIEQAIGVQVDLRWKFINTSKYISDYAIKKKWMALHVEVDEKNAKQAKRGLTKFYSSTSNVFPLGIRMRLVAEYRDVKGNPIMMAKHARLRARQASFISVITGHPSDDILLLDHNVNGKTLRDMIMHIKSFNKATPGYLFHSVGQNWKGRYIFNFLQSKAEEAAMIVDGIIPYLVHCYGKDVYQFFDPGAIAEKEDWVWDKANNTVINPLSRELDGLGGMDADFDFTASAPIAEPTDEEPATVMEKNTASTAVALASNRLNMVLNGIDNDSISTLGNPISPVKHNHKPSPSVIEMPALPSGSSVNSGITLDSRVSAIESQISTMQSTVVAGVDAKLEAFFTKFMAAQSAAQLPGGEVAGRPNV